MVGVPLTPLSINCWNGPSRFEEGFKVKEALDWQNIKNWHIHHIEDFCTALPSQRGLELVPTNMPIEMLVIEKAN